MRQPSSTGRRYNDYGYLPKTAGSATRGGGASSTVPNAVNPSVVVNGHGNDGSIDSMGSGNRHRSGVQSQTESERLGNAANPNRSDMPDTGRRKSFDPVSVIRSSIVLYISCTCICIYTSCTCTCIFLMHECTSAIVSTFYPMFTHAYTYKELDWLHTALLHVHVAIHIPCLCLSTGSFSSCADV